MAKAVEEIWPGPLNGLVVTRHGHAVALRAHRDRRGQPSGSRSQPATEAAATHLDLVQGLGPDDLVLALISGGGSALLSLPAPGLTLGGQTGGQRALCSAPARRSAR